MVNITLLRHGALKGAGPGICYGFSDFPLSLEGKAQAIAAGRLFKGRSFDSIFCSPLLRARQTLELVAGVAGIDASNAVLDERLMEMNFGELEGWTFERIAAQYPKLMATVETDFMDCAFPGGETSWQFYRRAESFAKALMAKDEGSVLAVCHGGVMRAIICACMGIAPENTLWRFKIDYCGCAELECANGWGRLTALGAPLKANLRGNE